MHDFYNCRYIGKEIIELTVMQNKILDLLLINKNRVVTHKELAKLVYNAELDNNLKKNIATHISRLNKKLKGELHIFNKLNKGYTVCEDIKK